MRACIALVHAGVYAGTEDIACAICPAEDNAEERRLQCFGTRLARAYAYNLA